MNYNLADFVKFPKGNGTGIGRIEDFNREEDWFEYFEYLTAEELGKEFINILFPLKYKTLHNQPKIIL